MLQLVTEQQLYAEALRLFAAHSPQYKVRRAGARRTRTSLTPAPRLAGSERRVRRAPGGAAAGGAGRPVAMAMRGAGQSPAGVHQQLQLEERHLCGPGAGTAARPAGSAGQGPGR